MSTNRPLAPARIVRYLGSVALSILVIQLAGCSGGVGDVSGKVSYKNKPVVFGSVSFVGSDGIPRSARINPDGTYTVKDMAVGEAKITVVSDLPAEPSQAKGGRGGRRELEVPSDGPRDVRREESPPGLGRGEVAEAIAPEVRKNWFAIPAELGDVTRTKLRFTVRKGPNTHDIVLD